MHEIFQYFCLKYGIVGKKMDRHAKREYSHCIRSMFFFFVILCGHILHMVHSSRPIFTAIEWIRYIPSLQIFLHYEIALACTAQVYKCRCTWILLPLQVASERPTYDDWKLLWLIYRSLNWCYGLIQSELNEFRYECRDGDGSALWTEEIQIIAKLVGLLHFTSPLSVLIELPPSIKTILLTK